MSRQGSAGPGAASWQEELQGLATPGEGPQSLEPEEGEGEGMTWAVGMPPPERRGWKEGVVLELEWSGGERERWKERERLERSERDGREY